jgi:hypothetical protein
MTTGPPHGVGAGARRLWPAWSVETESLVAMIADKTSYLDPSARESWTMISGWLTAAQLDNPSEIGLLCETGWRLALPETATRAWVGLRPAITQVFESRSTRPPFASEVSAFIEALRAPAVAFCAVRAAGRPTAFESTTVAAKPSAPERPALVAALDRIRAQSDAPIFLPVLVAAMLYSTTSRDAVRIVEAVDEILRQPGMLSTFGRRRARWVAYQLPHGWMTAEEVARYLREHLIDADRTNDPFRVED